MRQGKVCTSSHVMTDARHQQVTSSFSLFVSHLTTYREGREKAKVSEEQEGPERSEAGDDGVHAIYQLQTRGTEEEQPKPQHDRHCQGAREDVAERISGRKEGWDSSRSLKRP